MENKSIKPTFGATPNATTVPTNNRSEIGAIWERSSKTSNKPYLNVKLNLTKSKLQQLLATASGEEVNISLVAFPNEYKETGDNRPNFRIYEETKR
jgi:uncharacterized protein (DUF736 family)